MSSPTGPDQNTPQGGSPQEGQPGWGTPQPPPPGYNPPGYSPAPSYNAGPAYSPPVMPFPDAVRSVLTQYVTFTGRARRSEYWWFVLFNVIVSAVAGLLDAIIGGYFFQVIVGLGLLLPALAVGARRLHDIGRSGWWLLIGLVPFVGAILLIVWFCQDSQPGSNEHGPSPKYPAASGH
jgi:uncharacterized membrane protein YhaH (DUF805 family)